MYGLGSERSGPSRIIRILLAPLVQFGQNFSLMSQRSRVRAPQGAIFNVSREWPSGLRRWT